MGVFEFTWRVGMTLLKAIVLGMRAFVGVRAIRDNDSIYGEEFISRVKQMGIEEVRISPHSPWQNPYVERIIGSVRRECLDHVIVFGEDHLRHLLREYFSYYHADRPHLSLDRNAPDGRQVEPPEKGRVVSQPRVGGLHHRYHASGMRSDKVGVATVAYSVSSLRRRRRCCRNPCVKPRFPTS